MAIMHTSPLTCHHAQIPTLEGCSVQGRVHRLRTVRDRAFRCLRAAGAGRAVGNQGRTAPAAPRAAADSTRSAAAAATDRTHLLGVRGAVRSFATVHPPRREEGLEPVEDLSRRPGGGTALGCGAEGQADTGTVKDKAAIKAKAAAVRLRCLFSDMDRGSFCTLPSRLVSSPSGGRSPRLSCRKGCKLGTHRGRQTPNTPTWLRGAAAGEDPRTRRRGWVVLGD